MMNNLWNALKNPPKKYRPIPFWSWNEKLDVKETQRQIGEMDQVGIGGYFMHARGGLQTEYMGDQWMENIAAGIAEAKQRSMGAWAYDENGWPSGFGDSKVSGRGEEFQQKYLSYELVDSIPTKNNSHDIMYLPYENGRYFRFYYDVNPFYVDTLDANVTKTFLTEIYEPYMQQFSEDLGKAMPGFFTDEPQMSRKGFPWSLTIPDAYQKAYDEDLLPLLPQLFLETGDYKRTRYRFWHLVQELFVTNFTEQIYNWCNDRGIKLTGHMVLEESLLSQLTTNGAIMPHYEFFHIPGMDWLGRHINPPTTPLQVASVAHQLGYKQVLSETFALTGWNISFQELKWMFEWQLVRGATLLCQHLEGYSLRGIRKRDYPPSLFYQQPWWDKYRVFNDTVSRLGMILSEGRPDFEVLVLHPQSSAWVCFNNKDNQQINDLNGQFLQVTACLEQAHVPLHYGDERILRRHGAVQDDSLVVGCQSYQVVIVPPTETLAASTLALLIQFQSAGGKILWVGKKPSLIDGMPNSLLTELLTQGKLVTDPTEIPNSICSWIKPISVANDQGEEIGAITATRRQMTQDDQGDDYSFYYFVNSDTEQSYDARIQVPGSYAWSLNTETGSIQAVAYTAENQVVTIHHQFPAQGSMAIFTADTNLLPDLEMPLIQSDPVPLSPQCLADPWQLTMTDPNALTLDYCDVWFDDQLQGEDLHVSVIQGRAMSLERPVHIKMRFLVNVSQDYVPSDLFLVIERPEQFQIRLNDAAIVAKDLGYYRDSSFRKLDIRGKLKPGDNELWLEMEFKQSEAIYEQLRRAKVFESERNKLTYDSEVEALYLVGDFDVITPGTFTDLPRNAVSYHGPFSIGPAPVSVDPADLSTQGLPFFCGRVVLSKTVTLQEHEIDNRCFQLKDKRATVVGLRVNGVAVTDWYWRPYQADLAGLLVPGENKIELELTGSLRNLLGPHHLQDGESYAVRPASFFKEPNIWGNQPWTDDYCFILFGVLI